jgi:HlyD family secretion protein
MKKILRTLLLVLLIAAAGYAGYLYFSREKPVEVVVSPVERGKVAATVSNTRAGTIKARHRARLAPAIGGQIATLNVHEGDLVEKDQILLSLWNEDIGAELQLARGEAEVAGKLAEEACLQAAFSKRDANRLGKLRQQKSASESAHDKAVTAAAVGRISCGRARQQAEVAALRVTAVQARFDRTILRAPFSGIVAEVNGEIGEFITPSPTGVATLPAVDLIDPGELYVTAPIDEMDAARIEADMVVRINLDAFRDREFVGRVLRIAPYVLEIAKQARTVEVECGFAEEDRPQNLLTGYSADVEIILEEREDVLRIPAEALLENDGVYVLKEGRLERRKVGTGLANYRYVEIRDGLSEGELVVTSIGREGVMEGAAAVQEPIK